MRVGPYNHPEWEYRQKRLKLAQILGQLTWRLPHLVVGDQKFVPVAGRTVGADLTIVLQQQQQREDGDADREDAHPEHADRVSKSLVAVLVAADLVVDVEIRLRLTELAA